MKTKATILALALAASLGLVACDDSPSYGSGGWYPVFFPQPAQPQPERITRYKAPAGPAVKVPVRQAPSVRSGK
jgi:hypothetical protein